MDASTDEHTAPDWTIAQNWGHYTAADHATWQQLFERQSRLLPGRAGDAFMNGLHALPLSAEQIPDFDQLSEVLMRRTGWQVVAVPGLVPDEVFFEHLANRRFPAGNFIRRSEQLDYIAEPDVFHDVFGHAPMLMHPALADFIQAYGQGGLRALALGQLPQLARLYWYTVEFGLIEQQGGLRIYGAGIVSSFAETRYALEDPKPQRLRLDLKRVMRTRYRIDDFQQSYFVIRSLDELLAFAQIDFTPLYAQTQGLPEIAPDEQVLGDEPVQQENAGISTPARSAWP